MMLDKMKSCLRSTVMKKEIMRTMKTLCRKVMNLTVNFKIINNKIIIYKLNKEIFNKQEMMKLNN